ncbi:MAG: hypothetical protein P8X60_10320, partial [Robiginitalea sp.]
KSDRGRKFSISQVNRLMRSFKVRRFRMEIDTGDPVLNAKLYPLFFHLERHAGSIRLNFINRNHLLLQITNRPINLLKAIITT